jgi:hypothetical protein
MRRLDWRNSPAPFGASPPMRPAAPALVDAPAGFLSPTNTGHDVGEWRAETVSQLLARFACAFMGWWSASWAGKV